MRSVADQAGFVGRALQSAKWTIFLKCMQAYNATTLGAHALLRLAAQQSREPWPQPLLASCESFGAYVNLAQVVREGQLC